MLIVGAGPTGLVLALWLTRLGVRVQIIDRLAESGSTSRALAVQGRTLEFYQQIGLAQAVMARCHKVPALNLWVKSAPAARVPIETMGQGLTPYPNPVIFPQDEHERLLIERLREAGVQVERMLELTGFADDGLSIRATVRRDGSEETREYAYIAGCDGARSKVREVLGTGFPGNVRPPVLCRGCRGGGAADERRTTCRFGCGGFSRGVSAEGFRSRTPHRLHTRVRGERPRAFAVRGRTRPRHPESQD